MPGVWLSLHAVPPSPLDSSQCSHHSHCPERVAGGCGVGCGQQEKDVAPLNYPLGRGMLGS